MKKTLTKMVLLASLAIAGCGGVNSSTKEVDKKIEKPTHKYFDSVPAWIEEPVAIDSGDYDNDGDEDLIVASSTRYSADLWILENNGEGVYDKKKIDTISVDPQSNLAITGTDYNGDGFRDFIFAHNDFSRQVGHRAFLYRYKNNGDGSFSNE